MSNCFTTGRALIAAALGLFLLSGAASPTMLHALLQKGVERGYPGVAMAIRYRDGATISAAAGYASLEDSTPLRADDAFQICSVTKTFTAVAVLRLVDQGKLHMDDKLASLLPSSIIGRIPYSDRITLQQLLDHSSGIHPTNNELPYIKSLLGPDANPKHSWTPEELVSLAYADHAKPEGMPGSGHYYSDTNYVLLGLIVEKVVHQPLREHIIETIFKPLGMKDSYYYSERIGRAAAAHGRETQGYLYESDDIRNAVMIGPQFKHVSGKLINTSLAAERIDAAAGIVSTLPDMLKFGTALFGGKLLSPQSQAFLMSSAAGMEHMEIGKQRIRAMQAVRWPYGILIEKEGDGSGGFNSLLAYEPSTGTIYVSFTNSFGYFDEEEFLMRDVIGGLHGQTSH